MGDIDGSGLQFDLLAFFWFVLQAAALETFIHRFQEATTSSAVSFL
jgi:hypothetical protein